MSEPETIDAQERQLRLGRALRSLRESLGLTIYDVARRMGKSRSSGSQIGRWERGEVEPGAVQLWALLDVLRLNFAHLENELNPTPIDDPVLADIARRLREMA